MAVLLNIKKFNYPFTLKQKSFLENFFKFAPPYIQTVLMLRSYKKDSRLIAAGDSCTHVYILLKGRLEAVEEHVANIPYHFTEIRALDIVGDYEFFTEKQPRLVTIATLEDSLCLVIPVISISVPKYWSFRSICFTHPSLLEQVSRFGSLHLLLSNFCLLLQ